MKDESDEQADELTTESLELILWFYRYAGRMLVDAYLDDNKPLIDRLRKLKTELRVLPGDAYDVSTEYVRKLREIKDQIQ